MIRIPTLFICCAMAIGFVPQSAAQTPQIVVQSAPAGPSYPVLARLVLGAPVIIDSRVKSADRVDAQAPGLTPGRARFYIIADVAALIRGSTAIPAQVSFLADVPLDAKGKPPKLKKARLMLFARPIPGQPGQVQLTGIDSQRGWTADLDSRIRSITREVLAPDAAPAITGVGNAFFVPGSLPGEGETQIFLTTATELPVSLQILRRPGEQPRWAVSLGEIVDDAAGAPARNTLLWFRLACSLPKQLPDEAVASEEPANARQAREDYALVIRELGACA
jgi:hypothetical protein